MTVTDLLFSAAPCGYEKGRAGSKPNLTHVLEPQIMGSHLHKSALEAKGLWLGSLSILLQPEITVLF